MTSSDEPAIRCSHTCREQDSVKYLDALELMSLFLCLPAQKPHRECKITNLKVALLTQFGVNDSHFDIIICGAIFSLLMLHLLCSRLNNGARCCRLDTRVILSTIIVPNHTAIVAIPAQTADYQLACVRLYHEPSS